MKKFEVFLAGTALAMLATSAMAFPYPTEALSLDGGGRHVSSIPGSLRAASLDVLSGGDAQNMPAGSHKSIDMTHSATMTNPNLYQVAAGYGETLRTSRWDGKHQTGVSSVPEPGTVMLLGAGMLGLVIYRKRRDNR